MGEAGATRMLAKPLAQNDNSKQQIYLGGSFEILNQIPFGEVIAESSSRRPNFKAALNFHWLTPNANIQQAPGAQLILYPDYPEVRLSGFLHGCSAAPSKLMQPVAREQRGEKNSWDGRVLFFGMTPDGKVLASVSPAGSKASLDFDKLRLADTLDRSGALYILPALDAIRSTADESRKALLATLTDIARLGWTDSIRMYADGSVRPYKATNGGGYTLEALLGIVPNGRSEPDFLGWEIKAHSSSRVTLMTPEPNGGFYGEKGVQAFLRKYGRKRDDGVIYFTGTHTVGNVNTTSGHLLQLNGFDAIKNRINDVAGGIELIDVDGKISASWTFTSLLSHWARKHAQAAYIPYESRTDPTPFYRFAPQIKLATGTNFTLFLGALARGDVVYDPAPKLTGADTGNPSTKARSQFRTTMPRLSNLYHQFESVKLSTE
jgi:hypothetical protein